MTIKWVGGRGKGGLIFGESVEQVVWKARTLYGLQREKLLVVKEVYPRKRTLWDDRINQRRIRGILNHTAGCIVGFDAGEEVKQDALF
jgi:hypothetical protein